ACDLHVHADFANHNADDVGQAPALSTRGAPRPHLPRKRAHLRMDSAGLRAFTRVGIAPPAPHAAGHHWHHSSVAVSLYRHSEGLLPAAGYWPVDWPDPRRSGDFLPGHA